MSNFNSCPFPSGFGCPYQTEDGYNNRNRFPHGNLFVGEIENGKRYPYDVYNKAEVDAMLALKADEAEAVEIRARLDSLEANEFQITSLIANPAICELGSANSIILSWSYNKQAVTQSINGSDVTGNTKLYTGIATAQEYTLTASDGQISVSKSVSVDFANQIYYGAASSISSVTSLSKVLSNDKTRIITVNAGSGEHIIYAIPARLGTVAFYVSGFEGGFDAPEEQMLTNESGYVEKYLVYKSTHTSLGATVVEVKED